MAIKHESVNKDNGQSLELLLEQAHKVGEDEQIYWDGIEILRKRGDRETFDAVLELTGGDGFERSFAATVLSEFGEPRAFSAEIVNRLLEMVATETDSDVMGSLASSLGHQEPEPRVFEALKTLSQHHTWRVRWSVVMGLAEYKTPEAIEILIQLTTDSDEVIRDWATFGLNNRDDADTPTVRAAFVARLEDEDADTRKEALYGLAKLHDSRVIPAVLREVNGENSQPKLFDLVEDAPDYRLLPALLEMAKDPNYQGYMEELQAAIAACEAQSIKNSDDN